MEEDNFGDIERIMKKVIPELPPQTEEELGELYDKSVELGGDPQMTKEEFITMALKKRLEALDRRSK